jgi:hypothetical protein
MKIHVVGTCQSIPLAQCLELMVPSVPVLRYASFDDVNAQVADGDVIFRQRNRHTVWMPQERAPNEFLYPRVAFNAFHPDAVSIVGPPGPLAPPLGDDHSSLVLYAWHRGLDASEAERLFCEPVFERLRFFDHWEAAKQTLLEEGRTIDFPLESLLAGWTARGRFMHSRWHPALFVTSGIARALLERAGLPLSFDRPEDFIGDMMLEKAVWPIYPEIGRRLGLPGAYAFKMAHRTGSRPAVLDLGDFIARSYEAYRHMPAEVLACKRLDNPAYRDLERVAASARTGSRDGTSASAPSSAGPAREGSPYAHLPPSRFWRRAIERVAAQDVDPVGTPPFAIDRSVRIATAGSCFAQNMSHVLVRHGYNYFVAEPPPAGLPAADARRAGYGVFSSRSGNVYTARQLLQLFDRAFGTFVPLEATWLRPDGRYADPFRPQIEPDGFATESELSDARAQHLAAVRTMFEQLDVFIFTLGLTEAWRSRADGAVFPLAPGVAAGTLDETRHEFVNFTTAQVASDLDLFLTRLGAVNPRGRVVLTVSPQPPIATYEPRHVLVSATYTKAALRAAADEIERRHPEVWYFPGYELVAGAFNRGAYYERDLRTVTPAGVAHVMRLFLAHGAAEDGDAIEIDPRRLEENRAEMDVVCDEEAIAFDGTAQVVGDDVEAAAKRAEYASFLDRAIPMEQRRRPVVQTTGGTMEPLQPSSMRVRIDAELPNALRARGVVTVPWTISNDGDVALMTGGTHPVFACYRWFDASGNQSEVGDSIHTALPAPLEPGASMTVPVPIAAPRYAGGYELRVTLLQSEIAWFDDVDSSNGCVARVAVSD